MLTKKYYNEIEEDASELMWSLFGQAVHHIADRANIDDVSERRLYWKVSGVVISGQMDSYNKKTGTLTDYKTATVSKFLFKDFKGWEEQQNCYAQLLRWHKEPINELKILGIVRDHRPKEAEQAAASNKPYPQKAEMIDLPLWPEVRAIAFIHTRVAIQEMAKKELPLCTPQERWARADTWAVKKIGMKYAISGHSNYASKESAKMVVDALGKGYYIEHRPGRNTRCETYCNVSRFCEQFKNLSTSS